MKFDKTWVVDHAWDICFIFAMFLVGMLVLLPTEVWVRLRRQCIILIWGYGGDAVEWCIFVVDAIVIEPIHALVDPGYARNRLYKMHNR